MLKDHKVCKRLKEYTASAINTNGETYKKIIAGNEKDTHGAIEKAIIDWYDFLDSYRQNNVLTQQGTHKLKSLNFFSGITKAYQEETLEEYTKKYIAMMMRCDILNGGTLDSVWGTKWNCEHAMRYYFNSNHCFVMEGTNDKDKDVLKNGFTPDKWEIDGKEVKDSSLFVEDAGLINIKGVRLSSNTILKTRKTIVINSDDDNKDTQLYSLHFFLRCRKAGDNKECIIITFTNNAGIIIFKKTYTADSDNMWINKREYIKLEDGEYNIEIKGANNCDCDFDFMCLFPSVNYPSISVLIGHGGAKNGKAMFFAPGKADKVKNEKGEFIFTNDIEAGTYQKYKFWFPFADDTTAEAKAEYENWEKNKNAVIFDDPRWGYWTQDGYFISLIYFAELLNTLLPVGVKVFDIITTKKM